MNTVSVSVCNSMYGVCFCMYRNLGRPASVFIFQEFTWWSIDAYFAQFAPPEAKKKFRNTAQKRKFIVEVLEMPLQFDRVLVKTTL